MPREVDSIRSEMEYYVVRTGSPRNPPPQKTEKKYRAVHTFQYPTHFTIARLKASLRRQLWLRNVYKACDGRSQR
jgi:hypothetical protein